MKKSIFAALAVGTILLSGLATPASATTIFTLDQDGCTGTCGTGPFGTVALDQTTSSLVTVTLTLASGEYFAGTGAGNALAFNVNDSALTLGNITSGFVVGPLSVKASKFGTFSHSIACDACQGGQSGNLVGPLTFTVSSGSGVTIDDFKANTDGYFFASDITGLNGKTGNVAAGDPGVPSATPEPASLALIGLGLSGVALFKRRVRN